MKPISEMTYEEWKRYKAEKERRITHGAERINSETMYSLLYTIDKYCFNGKLGLIKLYWIPDELAEENPGAAAMYGYKCIMIKREFFNEHRFDTTFINVLYHESVHAFCDFAGIKDTDGEKHLQAFADACKAHGGECYWSNDIDGYTDTRLTPNSFHKVKAGIVD